jgi:hypothetical protein
MTLTPPTRDPATEWRSAQLLYGVYTALAREFMIDLPPCTEFEIGGDAPPAESVEVAQMWLQDMDRRIPVHQLRHFLQTSSQADEACLQVALEHHLRKPQSSESDRDKIDFLLVQFFSLCAQAPLEDARLDYVARILEPVLGTVDVNLRSGLQPLEELVQSATACRGLQELFTSGILEKGRKLKFSSDLDYLDPAVLVAFTRFNFLMRRAFFRLMHEDLNIILEGLRQLELQGVETLDCRKAEFSADEPVGRLRIICQSWKVMFQAEYCSGQPLRLLADLRDVVDDALATGVGTESAQTAAVETAAGGAPLIETPTPEAAIGETAAAATPASEISAERALAAAASAGSSGRDPSAGDEPDPGDDTPA